MVKRHVLIFTNLYPTPTEPERGIFIYQLVQEIKKRYKVSVICPIPWVPKFRFLSHLDKWKRFANIPKRMQDGDITVYYLRYPLIPKMSDTFHASLIFLGTFFSILKIMKQLRYPIISAHWMYPDCVSAVLLKMLIPVGTIVSARGCDLNRDIKDRFLAHKFDLL